MSSSLQLDGKCRTNIHGHFIFEEAKRFILSPYLAFPTATALVWMNAILWIGSALPVENLLEKIVANSPLLQRVPGIVVDFNGASTRRLSYMHMILSRHTFREHVWAGRERASATRIIAPDPSFFKRVLLTVSIIWYSRPGCFQRVAVCHYSGVSKGTTSITKLVFENDSAHLYFLVCRPWTYFTSVHISVLASTLYFNVQN